MNVDSKTILIEDVWGCRYDGLPLYGVIETLDKKFMGENLFKTKEDAEKVKIEYDRQMPSLVWNEYKVVKVEKSSQIIGIDLPFQNGYYFTDFDALNMSEQQGNNKHVDDNS